MYSKNYISKNSITSSQTHQKNIVNFNDIEKSSSNETTNIVDNIALEVFKKASVSGTIDDIVNEYKNIRDKIAEKIANKIDYLQTNDNNDICKKTIFDDYIICLEDGKKMQMLKRHLKTHYNMTFQEYKKKWGLPIDYPYVCKNYSKVRANIAGKRKKKNTN